MDNILRRIAAIGPMTGLCACVTPTANRQHARASASAGRR